MIAVIIILIIIILIMTMIIKKAKSVFYYLSCHEVEWACSKKSQIPSMNYYWNKKGNAS